MNNDPLDRLRHNPTTYGTPIDREELKKIEMNSLNGLSLELLTI